MRAIVTVQSTLYTTTTPDRLEQIVDHEALRKKYEESLIKDWTEDVQLPAKLKKYPPAFSGML